MYNLCNSQSRFDYYFFTANFSTGQFLETVAVVSTRQGKVRGYCYDDLVIFKGDPLCAGQAVSCAPASGSLGRDI